MKRASARLSLFQKPKYIQWTVFIGRLYKCGRLEDWNTHMHAHTRQQSTHMFRTRLYTHRNGWRPCLCMCHHWLCGFWCSINGLLFRIRHIEQKIADDIERKRCGWMLRKDRKTKRFPLMWKKRIDFSLNFKMFKLMVAAVIASFCSSNFALVFHHRQIWTIKLFYQIKIFTQIIREEFIDISGLRISVQTRK